MKAPRKIGRLIFKYIQRDLNFIQEKELKEWRNLSEANEAFFQQETSLEYIRDRMKTHEKNKAEIWEKLRHSYPPGWVEGAPRKSGIVIRMLKYAAFFIGGLFVLAGGFTVYEMFLNPATPKNFAMMASVEGELIMMNDFQLGWTAGIKDIKVKRKGHGELLYIVPNNLKAPKGQQDTLWTGPRWRFEMQMSDGSDIWMNLATMIGYPANYNFISDSVHYSVLGEAFFKIPANSNKRYRITNDSLEIQTTGGGLDVRANIDSAGPSVLLVSGSASVKALYPAIDGTQTIDLIPGQQVRLSDGKLIVEEHPNIISIIGWKR